MASSSKNDVLISISGDARGAQAATEAVSKAFGKLRGDIGKTFGGLGDQVFNLRGVLGSLAAGFSLKAVIDASVESERTLAQLEAVLKSTQGAAGVTRDAAVDLAAGLQQVTTYGDEAILGAENLLLTFTRIGKDVFPQATETVLDLSTAMGTDLKSSALQLGKALNDPVEGISALTRVGVTFTDQQKEQIKALAEAGRIADAQRLILAELTKEFGNSARAARDTFGGALAGLKEASGDLLEGDGGNLSDAKVAIEDFTKALQTPEVKQGFSTFTGGVITLASALAKLAGLIANAAKATGEFFGELAVGSTVPFQNQIDELLAKIKNTESQLAGARFLRFPTEQYEKDLARYRAELTKTQAAQADFLNMGKAKPKPQAVPTAAPVAAPTVVPPVDPKVAAAAAKAAADAAKKLADAVAAGRAAVFKAQQEQDKAALEAQLADNTISLQAYYAERLRLEQAAIDQEIAARQAALSRAEPAERAKLVAEIQALNIQRQTITAGTLREQRDAEKKLVDDVADLQQRLLTATGQDAAARAQEIEKEFDELLARLRANGNEQGVEIAVKLKEAELAKNQLDGIRARIDAVTQAFQQAQQDAANQVQTGGLSQSAAQSVTRTAAESATQQLLTLRAELQGLGEDVPGVQETLNGLNQSLTTISQSTDSGFTLALRNLRLELANLQNSFAGEGATAFRDGLRGLFSDLVNGSASATDALRGFATSFAQSLADIATNALATAATVKLLEALGIGQSSKPNVGANAAAGAAYAAPIITASGTLAAAGGTVAGAATALGVSAGALQSAAAALAFANSLSAGVAHTGAIVGQGFSATRVIPPLAFAGAPRFHSGGFPGLKPDEYPVIAQRGEEILARSDPRNALNGGGGGATSAAGTDVVNVIDPNLLENFLTSSRGRKVLVNVIGQNPGAIKRVLG